MPQAASRQSGLSGSALSSMGDRVSLRDRATEVIRDALVSGELAPGEVCTAPLLAKSLGISATPVREAMIDLAREGLVEPLRNRGYRVLGISDRDLDELTELRALIEVPTMARVADRAAREQLDELRPLAEELNRTAESGAIREFVAADTQFHLRLLGLAGNSHLVETVRDLRGRTRLWGLAQLAESGRLVATAREHGELLDLLAEGNREGAMDLMARHIGHVRGVWAGRPET